jgi:hypothetical protein
MLITSVFGEDRTLSRKNLNDLVLYVTVGESTGDVKEYLAKFRAVVEVAAALVSEYGKHKGIAEKSSFMRAVTKALSGNK